MIAPSDADLIAATLAGRSEAYAPLVERYQRRLILSVRRLTGADRDAEEIAQDAFVRAWENLAQYDPAYPFFPWLARIAANLWHNRHRRRLREVALDAGADDEANGTGSDGDARLADDDPSPETLADEADVRDRVWRAVDGLPDDARTIVMLRHSLELSYDEICEITGLPIGTVKSRLSRARHALAAVLAPDGAIR